MKLSLKRSTPKNNRTLGSLYIDEKFFCSTLEDFDRNLSQSLPLESILERKKYGETAIPRGTYKVTLDVVSPKFSSYPFYQEVCNGKLPRLLDVPGFNGILIHVAEGPKADKLIKGCIGVGELSIEGYLINGKETFKKLYSELLKDKDNIIIEIS